MFHISGMFEDCLFHATRTGSQTGDKWIVTICDGLTGYQQTHEWSDEQLGVSLMLAIVGEGSEVDNVARAMEILYPFAVDAAKMFEVPSQHHGHGVTKSTLSLIP